jgi:hypothetical protein
MEESQLNVANWHHKIVIMNFPRTLMGTKCDTYFIN